MSPFRHVLVLLVALSLNWSAAVAADPVPPPPANKQQTFVGKVQPVSKTLENLGLKPDADSTGIALVTADGTVYSLVKDEKTRLLFLDKQLHDKQVQLTARQLPGTQFLHVSAVHTLKDGKLHEVFYWCENCQLRSNEPGLCKCCGGGTNLVEIPIKAK